MTRDVERTDDGRYLVVDGRRWRTADPDLPEDVRTRLLHHLGVARAAVKKAKDAGVEAELAGLVDVHDVILRQVDGALLAHYVIAMFCGHWRAGEPRPGDDELAARFVPLADIDDAARYRLTDGAAALIRRAHAQLHAAGDGPLQ